MLEGEFFKLFKEQRWLMSFWGEEKNTGSDEVVGKFLLKNSVLSICNICCTERNYVETWNRVMYFPQEKDILRYFQWKKVNIFIIAQLTELRSTN